MLQKKKQRSAGEPAAGYGTLATIRGLLDGFSPPAGSFDPEASWKQSYIIHLKGDALTIAAAGFLELRREVSRAGVALTVDTGMTQMTGAVQQTKAKLVCAADPLCSPKSWQLESVILDEAGQPVASTRLTNRAVVKSGGAIEAEFGRHKRAIKTPLPFTSNWSLFDAVQHLSGKGTAPLRFALLEDLDLLKPNQRLSFAETTKARVAGGRELALTGYEQIGEGVLPVHYWLDEQRRLLFVLAGQRVYLYDPEARNRAIQGRRGVRGST